MNNIVTFIVENWFVIIAMIALAAAAVVAIIKFVNLPNDKQKEKIQKCLLAWVIEAERELGGGTGRVKLSTVYGWFVTAFPFLKNFVSFDTFSLWVDDALDEMREMLEQNEKLKTVVEGNIVEVGTLMMEGIPADPEN